MSRSWNCCVSGPRGTAGPWKPRSGPFCRNGWRPVPVNVALEAAYGPRANRPTDRCRRRPDRGHLPRLGRHPGHSQHRRLRGNGDRAYQPLERLTLPLGQAPWWSHEHRISSRPALFTWEPDRRYDVVFMGFWLSHVPAERFGSFWALVAAALAPQGRVFFADDGYRTPEELIEGPASSTIERRTPDGTAYRIVKVPHEPADLERQLRALGWDITVTPTAGPFFWGAGNRAGTPAPPPDARQG